MRDDTFRYAQLHYWQGIFDIASWVISNIWISSLWYTVHSRKGFRAYVLYLGRTFGNWQNEFENQDELRKGFAGGNLESVFREMVVRRSKARRRRPLSAVTIQMKDREHLSRHTSPSLPGFSKPLAHMDWPYSTISVGLLGNGILSFLAVLLIYYRVRRPEEGTLVLEPSTLESWNRRTCHMRTFNQIIIWLTCFASARKKHTAKVHHEHGDGGPQLSRRWRLER
jgi:hypothetical protein